MNADDSLPTNYVWTGYSKVFEHKGVRFTLRGHARSAQESGFHIFEWRTLFEAGIPCLKKSIDFIFISHSHSDHALQLAKILTIVPTKPRVFVPKGTVEFYENLLVAKKELSDCRKVESRDFIGDLCTFVECEPGQCFDLKMGKSSMQLQILETDHRVPSVGYALFKWISRLRQEFRGLSGSELAAKRKQNVELNERYRAPQLIYTGDTTARWFELNAQLLASYRFPFVMCECTFVGALEDEQRAEKAATKYKHTCWARLSVQIERYNAGAEHPTLFILVHWSNRYTPSELSAFFEPIPNVVAWTW